MCVVAFHFSWGLHLPKFEFGFLAVDLFFVLSGIVLGRIYEPKILAGMTFVAFAWQRLRRLYPMLLIVTGAILAANVIGLPASIGSSTAFGPALALPLLIPYSPEFGAGALFAADSPVWSLWAELVVNAIWFSALRVGRRFTRNLCIAAAALFVVVVLVSGTSNYGVRSSLLDMALALVRALAWFGVGYGIVAYRPRPVALAWVALAIMVAGATLVQRHWLGGFAKLVFVFGGVALMMRLMEWRATDMMTAKACAWLGLVSYPLYLTHMVSARIALWATNHGVKGFLAYSASFVVVAVAATLLNEWIINRLPVTVSRSRRAVPA